jgi:hypothetical protein
LCRRIFVKVLGLGGIRDKNRRDQD